MIRYRPRYLSIALHLFIVGINLATSTYFLLLSSNEAGGMRFFLWGVICFLLLIAYLHAAPLLTWPCAVTIDRNRSYITFCYLLYRRTIPIENIKRCAVCEAINRYPYTAYILAMKNGGYVVLSALTIAQFPGPFAHNIGVDVTERLPRFIPGFRLLSHKRK